jgi:hypothetical protein
MFAEYKPSALLKLTAFWDMTPCCLVEVDWRFRDASCRHHQMIASETSVYFYKATWRHIPGGCQLHTCRCENLKSHFSPRNVFVTDSPRIMCPRGKGINYRQKRFTFLQKGQFECRLLCQLSWLRSVVSLSLCQNERLAEPLTSYRASFQVLTYSPFIIEFPSHWMLRNIISKTPSATFFYTSMFPLLPLILLNMDHDAPEKVSTA